MTTRVIVPSTSDVIAGTGLRYAEVSPGSGIRAEGGGRASALRQKKNATRNLRKAGGTMVVLIGRRKYDDYYY